MLLTWIPQRFREFHALCTYGQRDSCRESSRSFDYLTSSERRSGEKNVRLFNGIVCHNHLGFTPNSFAPPNASGVFSPP